MAIAITFVIYDGFIQLPVAYRTQFDEPDHFKSARFVSVASTDAAPHAPVRLYSYDPDQDGDRRYDAPNQYTIGDRTIGLNGVRVGAVQPPYVTWGLGDPAHMTATGVSGALRFSVYEAVLESWSESAPLRAILNDMGVDHGGGVDEVVHLVSQEL